MDWNQRLDNKHKYQVWITSWAEDGSKEVQDIKKRCSGYHAKALLVGQYENVADAVACVNAHADREPVMTKTVSWRTNVIDTTEEQPNATD